MKQKIVYFLVIVMALSFVYLRFNQMFQGRKETSGQITVSRDLAAKMLVGNVEIIVEIADTPQKQKQGLSGREPLLDKYGMLFPMRNAAQYSFWMKDMKFSLDIIWIKNGKIVDISENITAPIGNELPITVQPKEPADAILEMNSDFTEKYDVKIGDRAEFDGVWTAS